MARETRRGWTPSEKFLAEVGFARMVRPHLPQPVVEDLYQR